MTPLLTDQRLSEDAFNSLLGAKPAFLWPTAVAVLQRLKHYCNMDQHSATYALGAS
jgi:hypothetical protein